MSKKIEMITLASTLVGTSVAMGATKFKTTGVKGVKKLHASKARSKSPSSRSSINRMRNFSRSSARRVVLN